MEYDMDEMLLEIDAAMPEKEQIGEYLKAKEIPTEELKVGDTVFVKEFDGKFIKHFIKLLDKLFIICYNVLSIKTTNKLKRERKI